MEISILKGHECGVCSVVFNNNGTILVSGSYDSTIKLWNIETKTEIISLDTHECMVTSVIFNHTGTILASPFDDKAIKL